MDKGKVIVKNSHHFNKGVELTIEDGKLTKIVSNRLSDIPVNSVEYFINKIHVLFRFCGIDCPEDFTFDVGEYTTFNDKPITGENFIWMRNIIFALPVEFEFKFISLSTCGCNMGYCGAITGMEIDEREYKTYGDIIKLVGPYYPDSVMLHIRQIMQHEIPSEIHRGNSCYSELIPFELKTEPNTIYLEWSYTR